MFIWIKEKPVVMWKTVVNQEPMPWCTGNNLGVVYSPGSMLKALITPSNKRIPDYCTQTLNIILNYSSPGHLKKLQVIFKEL